MNELTPHIPEGLAASSRDVLPGLLLVVPGLDRFIKGLSIGLFPLGGTMARRFPAPQHLGGVFPFAFCLSDRYRRQVERPGEKAAP